VLRKRGFQALMLGWKEASGYSLLPPLSCLILCPHLPFSVSPKSELFIFYLPDFLARWLLLGLVSGSHQQKTGFWRVKDGDISPPNLPYFGVMLWYHCVPP
jgi:hypothetical protein